MNITLFQQDIAWLTPADNWQKIEQVLLSHPETDLLVLPEMCLTGFVLAPEQEAGIPSDAEVEQQILERASRHQTAICGTFAVRVGNEYRNRAYFVQPDGCISFADKHHLFAPGGEARIYQPGQERCIVQYMGIRFFLLVCYDLRFPVWARYAEGNEYDCLICMANWPQARQLAWETLLPARAIENQCFVIGVNRCGEDPICPYLGGTRAIHPYGHIIASCPDAQESVCTFQPDMEKLLSFRQKFPTLMDADSFDIR